MLIGITLLLVPLLAYTDDGGLPISADEIVVHADADAHNNALIDQTFSHDFVLDQLTYDSDVYMQRAEFYYLVDLKQDASIAAADVKQAVAYLFKKNKFQKIRIRIDSTAYGGSLHFTLVGFWTFEKLKISGVLIGKDIYSQYYLMEPGDRFEREKHEHSIKKICDAFKKEGYLQVRVSSRFVYNSATKVITVHLTVRKGKRFVVGDVQLALKTDAEAHDDELQFIKHQIYKKFLKRLAGRAYSKPAIEEQAQEMKRYLAQKGYLHVFITLDELIDGKQRRIKLKWTIDLYQKRLFVFFGNRFFTNNQLLDQILQFGRSASLLPASMLSQEIVRAYHRKGFWDVQVEPREEDERYFFLIKEGKRAVIDRIELCNVHHFSSKLLMRRYFAHLRKRPYFDAELLQQSLDALHACYFKEGFLDASIVSHDFVPTEKEGMYTLVVALDEGVRTYLKEVSIPSLPALQTQGCFATLQKKIDQAPEKRVSFDTAFLQEQRTWLLDYLHKQGYLQAALKPEINKDEDNNVSLVWQVDRGEKVYFGKTIMRGSSQFPFAYVQRELQYNEGELWDQEKIKQSFLCFKACYGFESVQLSPVHDVPFGINKPVLLTLHNDDPFELRIRAGLELQNVRRYHTIAGLAYKIGGTFIMKNPFDAGDQLRTDIDLAQSHREIIMRYHRPWLFRLPVRTLLQAYSIKHDQPGFIGTKKDIYTIKQHGFLLGLGKKTRHCDGAINIGIEWMQTTITDVANKQFADQLAKAINFEPALLGITVPFLFIEPTLFIDYVDNKVNPTVGALSLFSLKGMVPLSKTKDNTYFVRLLVEQSLFIPLRRLVAALRLRFGHIFFQQFCAIMPTERFYLGGAQSLRSYETDLAPPLGWFTDSKGQEHTVPRGGKSMINGNAELRFPLFFKDVGGVVFQDIGMLSGDNFADFQAENMLAATGFGLRYYTPIGPVRFDIGFKWRLTSPSERRLAWFLTIGQTF